MSLSKLAQERLLSVLSALKLTAYLATRAVASYGAVARTGFWLFLFRSQGATAGTLRREGGAIRAYNTDHRKLR